MRRASIDRTVRRFGAAPARPAAWLAALGLSLGVGLVCGAAVANDEPVEYGSEPPYDAASESYPSESPPAEDAAPSLDELERRLEEAKRRSSSGDDRRTTPTSSPAATRLLVTTDADCALVVGERPFGVIVRGQTRSVDLWGGLHEVACRSVEVPEAQFKASVWLSRHSAERVGVVLRESVERMRALERQQHQQRETVTASATRTQNPTAVTPSMATEPDVDAAKIRADYLGRFRAEGGLTIRDAERGLVWTLADNGRDITWEQAHRHCSKLRLAGRPGWRLPSSDELASLYAEHAGETTFCRSTCRVLAAFRLTSYAFWSGTAVNFDPAARGGGSMRSGSRNSGQRPEAWIVHLSDGKASRSLTSYEFDTRALCVRPE